jgi:hypothetical protein
MTNTPNTSPLDDEWENNPETVRHLWLVQSSACDAFQRAYYFLGVENPSEVYRMQTVVQWREIGGMISPLTDEQNKLWEVACAAKERYEAAGGTYRE